MQRELWMYSIILILLLTLVPEDQFLLFTSNLIIVAPGAFINTTDTNGNYKISSGTSFAAPHVAGTAALILQKNPQLITTGT